MINGMIKPSLGWSRHKGQTEVVGSTGDDAMTSPFPALPLLSEAGLAAEAIAFGATVLGRANYAQQGYYAQAFFSLSVGLERSGKLALVLDYALDNQGAFPSGQALRSYGHDLKKLLTRAEAIAQKRGIDAQLPATDIHDGIVSTLTDFATNVTRYYNLEYIAGEPAAISRDSPIASWYKTVMTPVLTKHYGRQIRTRVEQRARVIEATMGSFSMVRHFAETGELIDSVYEGSRRTGERNAAIPWERMYVLQLGRFIGRVLGDLGYIAQATLPNVPFLSEFFAIFNNSDSYFRSRKTWSIYPS